MPAACLICGATKKDGKIKLFPFVRITKELGHLQEISKRRRHEWLRIHKNEKELTESKTGHYICSRHFKSGEPAKVGDVTDPDWLPTQNLVPSANVDNKPNKCNKARPPIERTDPPAMKYKKSTACTSVGMEPNHGPISAKIKTLFDERDETITQLKRMLEKKDLLIHSLQMKLKLYEMDETSFANDLKIQFYTGFATYKCFEAFANTVGDLLPQCDFPNVSKMKILIIVTTKLRLNLPITYMSITFGIPYTQLCEIFTSSVRTLSDNLQVSWPATRKIPMSLKNIFGEQLAAIVDILELALDGWSGISQSIKFLIAYSPCGKISFISNPFDGICSDSRIFIKSGVMKQLKSSDLILALRGTLNENVTVPGGKRDEVFMYTVRNCGLIRLQWSHSLASEIRLSLRSVMDQVTTIFGFLGHKQPEIRMKDPIVFLHKIVILCAALRNLILTT